MKRVLIWSAPLVAACAAGLSGADRPGPCPDDTSVYSYRDTANSVVPPILVRSNTPPRAGLSRTTAQGIVGHSGRIERGSVRTFGGAPEERLAAGDALYWSRFQPAMRGGCTVRFLYRVTYMAGIRQRVPDDPADTTTMRR